MKEGVVLIEVAHIKVWTENSYRVKVASKCSLFLPKSAFLGYDESDDYKKRIYVAEWWFNKNSDWLCKLS